MAISQILLVWLRITERSPASLLKVLISLLFDEGSEIKNAIKVLDAKFDMISTQTNARLDGTHQTLAHTNQTLDAITERLGRLEQRQAARWVYVPLKLDVDVVTFATIE